MVIFRKINRETMQFKVYVIYSPGHDRIFTGMTTSLTDRMESHNGEDPEDWISSYKPWTLIHMELFEEEYQALNREAYFESEAGQDHIRSEILPIFIS